MRLKINIILWMLLLICSHIYGQMDTYKFKRELSGISDSWHIIILPDQIFKNVSSDLSDIRIYGITKEKDTVEAPYLLKQNQPKIFSKAVNFQIINRSTTNKGAFVTYKVTTDQTINKIKLFFQQNNFDRLLSLEGSQNLDNWYTIVDDYRILSIKNKLTSYDFTTVKFPNSKYQYYRVFIKGSKAPEVNNAQVTLEEVQEANYKLYSIKSITVKEQKQDRTTVINIDLHTSVPVSYIQLKATNDFDYYRPVRIEYLKDSIQGDNGWRYNYRNGTSGVLNSIEENEFNFYSTITNKLRVIIDNKDNEPLDIDTIKIKGFSHKLIARFTTQATYFLAYRNENVSKPSYDLQYIVERVPEKLTKLQLGVKEKISQNPIKDVEPLFKNKIWLWAVMLIVVVLLGSFTLMMMKKK